MAYEDDELQEEIPLLEDSAVIEQCLQDINDFATSLATASTASALSTSVSDATEPAA